MKVRSYGWLNPTKTILIGLFLLLNGLSAQSGEVVPLSPKVGSTISAPENRYYRIFPDIKGFESAQIFDIGNERYSIRIVWYDHGRMRVTKRTWNLRTFVEIQTRVGETIPPSDRLPKEESLEQEGANTINYSDLSLHSEILIKPVKGRRFTGTILSHESNKLTLQTWKTQRTIHIKDIVSVTILDTSYDQSFWLKVVYGFSGLVGVGFAESLNSVANVKGDRRWYNRFLGLSFGLGLGVYLNDWVPFWILPHHEYNIRA